jgi:hypothetical protein
MALKLEHQCTRCKRITHAEVQNVAAATESEELEQKRADALKALQVHLNAIDPNLLPDLLIVRRGQELVIQTNLCAQEGAARSCAERVNILVKECSSFDPRKPKTRKSRESSPAPAEATDKKASNKKPETASAKN